MKKKVIICLLSLFAFTGFCFSDCFAQSARAHGKLQEIKGVRVLSLWGTPYQKGYAHGFFLADEILDLLENYMLGQMYDAESYWYTTALIEYYVRVPLRYRREIRGLYDGIAAARGDKGMFSKKLGRDFLPVDLVRWNMFEIFPLAFESRVPAKGVRLCSSISAWGKGTADGSTIMVRNLDFGSPGDLLECSSLIIAYENHSFLFSEKNWVSFAFPGIIGCLTGMNEDGVAAAVHYAENAPAVEDLFVYVPWFYVPLSFAVRDGLESWQYGLSHDPVAHLLGRLFLCRTAGSFNVHVIAPAGAGADPPAAVIEGNNWLTGLRTYADNRDYEPRLTSDNFLAVTNHHRKIEAPQACDRYETMVAGLNELDTLTVSTGLAIERSVVQTDAPYHTVQMIGFAADAQDLWVSFGDDSIRCYEKTPVYFSWEEIF